MDLNKLYEGAEFDLSEKYAKVLAFIFVCLTYSPGLPVLIPILFVYLFL